MILNWKTIINPILTNTNAFIILQIKVCSNKWSNMHQSITCCSLPIQYITLKKIVNFFSEKKKYLFVRLHFHDRCQNVLYYYIIWDFFHEKCILYFSEEDSTKIWNLKATFQNTFSRVYLYTKHTLCHIRLYNFLG